MRDRTRIVSSIAAGLLLLTACTGTAPEAAAPAESTFTYASVVPAMTDWDPATGYSDEVIAMSNMYEQLTRYDSTSGDVKPLLAESWTTSADGKTWTFTLRRGVTFSTGRPMDAAAAKAALERTIRLGGGAAFQWDPVRTISAPDESTLVFKLKYAAPLDLIASSAYSAYIYDTAAAPGDLAQWFEAGHTAGTGPYVVSSYHKGRENELTLTRNDAYWGGWDGNHYESIQFRVVPEETTAAQLLQSGEVTFVPRLSPTLFSSMQSEENISTSERSAFETIMAMFNTASGPLADVRVRRALAQAIDYDGIVTALKGGVIKATGVIPDGLLGYTTDVQQTTDVAAARAALEDAGYGPGGEQLTVDMTYTAGTPEFETIASLLKSDFAEVGVDLEARRLAWQTQWSLAKSADPAKHQDIFLFYWWPDYADPYSWFINLYHSADPVFFNVSYWDDPKVDAQIDGLQSLTATDRDKAEQEYVELQQTVADQAVSPVLGVTNYRRAYASSVGGYVDNPSYANVVFVYELTPQA